MFSLFFVFSCLSLIFPETTCLPQYWLGPPRILLLPQLTSYFLPPPPPLALLAPLGRVGVHLHTPPEDVITSSGLQIEMLTTSVSCTRRVRPGDRLTVHYTGHLANTGEEFDSSVGGDPITFVIGEGRLIQGWEEGLIARCEGDQLRLIVPPHLGYGEEGKRRAVEGGGEEGEEGGEEELIEEFVIPPHSTLVFKLNLVKVEPAME